MKMDRPMLRSIDKQSWESMESVLKKKKKKKKRLRWEGFVEKQGLSLG